MHLFRFVGRLALVSCLVVTGLLVTSAPEKASAATGLPTGFSVESIPTALGGDGSYRLTDIKYVTPATGVEGGLLAAGKNGDIAWVSDDGTSRILGRVANVRDEFDNGLVGITPAFDYATSRRIYVVYNQLGSTHSYGMLASWLVNSVARPTTATFERLVIDGVASNWIDDGPNHQVGDVLAWPDGSLFVTQGDGVEPSSANPTALWSQDYNDPHGKILHIRADGRGATDNPNFDAANPSSWRSRVFAVGVRNGFRLWRDPVSGRLLSSIVGWNNNEMVARIQRGGNYGWPCWEGGERTPGYSSMSQCQSLYNTVTPSPMIWTYPHNGSGASVTGGVTYTGSSYPAAYRNKTFVGDFARGQLWTFGTNGDTLTSTPTLFGSDVGAPTAITTCQNGDICWTDITNSRVMRLRYGLSNRAPSASFNSTVDGATRAVTFDAAESFDPEGDAITYAWQFGDGGNGTGIKPTHTYTGDGPFTVRLVVTDDLGNTGETTRDVSPANAPPVVNITGPTQTDYAVGDRVALSATATDREDGALPASGIKWSSQLQHCPFNGACHSHPSDSATGANFAATFPDHGGETTLVITATSPADSNGATSQTTYTATPRLRTVTVAAPAGVTATINSDVTNRATVVARAAVSVSVPTSSSAGPFQRWSDGVTTASRQLTMPDSDLTLTPVFGTAATTPISQAYASMGGTNSFLGAPTGNETAVAGGAFRDYRNGSLFYSSGTGVHYVKGAILSRYRALGGPPAYGFPTNDETGTPDGRGFFNRFTDGRQIYWTQATGAHEVHGGIAKQWVSLGAERSRLGYPTSDEYDYGVGRRSSFQRGYIVFNRTSGAIQVFYN